MKATKVQYTVQPSFAETNSANIRKVMQAIKDNQIAGVNYAAFRMPGSDTFVHVVVVSDDAAQLQLTGLDEFKAFQAALKESKPTSPPSPESWEVVGTSFDA